MKNLLWWIIAGSKGGVNRARIIDLLHQRPYNANQLTEILGLDYKTVRHHLGVLLENRVIESNEGEKYGTMYFLSRNMEDNFVMFQDIWVRVGKK